MTAADEFMDRLKFFYELLRNLGSIFGSLEGIVWFEMCFRRHAALCFVDLF